jgi:hypothetical protein
MEHDLRLSTNPGFMRFLAFWGPPSGQRDQAHVLHSGTSYQFQSIACECSARKRDAERTQLLIWGILQMGDPQNHRFQY